MRYSLLIIFSLLSGLTLQAQQTLNFESGSRTTYSASCWSFPGSDFITTTPIAGGKSGRTGQLTGNYANANGFWSPWVELSGSGSITFKHRQTAATWSGVSWRRMYMVIQKANTTTYDTVYSFTYSSGNYGTTQNVNYTIPSGYVGVYRVYMMFAGQGGTLRGQIDDISIAGTYKSNPSSGCSPIITIPDNDNDGVANTSDEYPSDSTKAYNNYYPSSSTFGTLMFEDLWPATGDYDFNDLVVNYNWNVITNGANQVVEVRYRFVTRAIGASLHNGFSFQLDNIAPNKISSIGRSRSLQGNLFTLSANGTEASQTYVNIPVFEDAYKLLVYTGGSGGINIDPAVSASPLDTQQITVVFVNNGVAPAGGRVAYSAFAPAIFNPYIVVNQTRGKEIHLADRQPSTLASNSYFGQDQDDSNPGTGRYYKTANNLPWAINVPNSVPYTQKSNDFVQAFKKFPNWSQSSGSSYTDWYSNTSSEYLDQNKIYVAP